MPALGIMTKVMALFSETGRAAVQWIGYSHRVTSSRSFPGTRVTPCCLAVSSSAHLRTTFLQVLLLYFKFSCQKAREVPGSFGSTLCSMWFHCMTDVFTHLSDPLLSKSSAMIIMVQNNCPTPAWSSGYCWTTLGTLVARRQAASLICPTVSPPHLPNHPSSSALLCCTQHTSSQHGFGSCTMN